MTESFIQPSVYMLLVNSTKHWKKDSSLCNWTNADPLVEPASRINVGWAPLPDRYARCGYSHGSRRIRRLLDPSLPLFLLTISHHGGVRFQADRDSVSSTIR